MLAVRWLHVLAAAVALGGATLTWWSLRTAVADDATALALSAGYERAFWAAMGVLVLTGVGNLGELAPFVPGADTEWGVAFTAKLLAVAAVLALSLLRTLVVQRCRRADALRRGGVRALELGYGATAAALAAVVLLAEVLAHG